MPAPEHAQPPPENAPPPSRRDHETPAAGHHGYDTCDCGGCLEFRAIHGRLSPELPIEDREIKRAVDAEAQRRYTIQNPPFRAAS